MEEGLRYAAMIQKQAVAIAVVAAIAVAAMGVGAFGALAQTETKSNNQTITVNGTGRVDYIPTRAIIQLAVVTESASLRNATSTNSRLVSDLLTRLSGLGLANYSVRTESYAISPIYSYTQEKTPTITGFRAAQNLEVEINDKNSAQLGVEAGKVIDAAVSAGINEIYNVQLTIPDNTAEQLRSKALQEASTEARAKAQAIVEPLGLRLLGVQSVTEGNIYIPGPIVFAGAGEGKPSTQITPGPLTISASVQVVYAIG